MSNDKDDSDPATGEKTEEEEAEAREHRRTRLELFSTALLAVAAIAAAWAGFQSAKWGGVQATNFSLAGAHRVESTRESTTAGQQAQVDVALYIDWLSEVREGIDDGTIPDPADTDGIYQPTPGTPSGFVFERFREEFRAPVQAWIDTKPFTNPNAPPTPFAMDTYELAADIRADELRDMADDSAAEARAANQTSDDYVLTAVLFALSLFFIAVATKLHSHRNALLTLGLGVVVLIATISRVVTLPIEF